MILRSIAIFLPVILYAWRVYDPVGSYEAFFAISDTLTGLLLSDAGASVILRSIVRLVLIDQADGFLIGLVFTTIVSCVMALGRRVLASLAAALRRGMGLPPILQAERKRRGYAKSMRSGD
jgi:hypothetical protein